LALVAVRDSLAALEAAREALGKVGKLIKEAIYEMQHSAQRHSASRRSCGSALCGIVPAFWCEGRSTVESDGEALQRLSGAVRGYLLTVTECVAARLGTTNSPELAQLQSSLHP
jgi:hypothetical protein